MSATMKKPSFGQTGTCMFPPIAAQCRKHWETTMGLSSFLGGCQCRDEVRRRLCFSPKLLHYLRALARTVQKFRNSTCCVTRTPFCPNMGAYCRSSRMLITLPHDSSAHCAWQHDACQYVPYQSRVLTFDSSTHTTYGTFVIFQLDISHIHTTTSLNFWLASPQELPSWGKFRASLCVSDLNNKRECC